MMRDFKRRLKLGRGERGNVFVIVVGTLTVLFMFSGIALDIGHIIAVKHQLKTAMDAGSLAGAAYLSLDPQSTANQDAARATASSYAAKNLFAGGAPTLSASTDNSGNVKTGIWDGSTWTPTTTPPSGTVLNAVRCQWSAPVTPAFLGLLGFGTINVTAAAVAAYGSPATPCQGCAVMPIGLPQCAFTAGASQGCGALIWSDLTNGTTVWANLNGTNANNNDITTQVSSAYSGTPYNTSWNLNAGSVLQTTTGDVGYGNMWNNLAKTTGCPGGASSCGWFVDKYNASSPFTGDRAIKNAAGTSIYEGKGWEVVVPILDMSGTNCNQIGSGSLTIVTWTYFVIVQVINGGKCTVPNEGWSASQSTPDSVKAPWKDRCDNMTPAGTNVDPNRNLMYGYYNCRHMDSPSTAQPVPMAAFSRPKIVQ